MIDGLEKSCKWRMHLTMKPKLMSSTDSNEKRAMYFKNDKASL